MIFDVELFDFFAGVVPDVFAGKRKNSDRGQRAPGARLFAAHLIESVGATPVIRQRIAGRHYENVAAFGHQKSHAGQNIALIWQLAARLTDLVMLTGLVIRFGFRCFFCF